MATGSIGKVYLIGAGPGDVELLTLKAVRCIASSDVILIDSLANQEVLKFAGPDAKVVHVGKRAGQYSVPQREIENKMLAYARAGLTVSRIKGGDPMIFARGGEELDALYAHRIPFEIISGITAASGVTAALGIPLTHRDLSHQLMFLTGPQFDQDKSEAWLPSLHSYTGTIVIYMGLKNCAAICKTLITSGMNENTPSVAVQSGTLLEQKAVFAPLKSLSQNVEQEGLTSPVLMVVGDVVSLSPDYKRIFELSEERLA